MSDIKQVDLNNLKAQAESLRGWFNTTDAWLDTSEDSACAVVGHISEDGALYPVAVVDCDQYDAPSDSMKLAKFYAAVNPKTILELVAALETLQAENRKISHGWVVAVNIGTEHLHTIEALQKENAELKEQIALFVGVEAAVMEQGDKSLCMQLAEANAVQAKRIAELESELVEWNEFKKIRDAQMQALRKQMP